MRLAAVLFVLLLLALVAVPVTQARAEAMPVNEYEGGTPWSCRWNPFAHWVNGWWVAEFQWYDGAGNTTGVRCA